MAELRQGTSLPDTFAATIAEHMHQHASTLGTRWLDRLLSLIPAAPNDVFPSDTILDHIPALIDQIAAYLSRPDGEDIIANTVVVAKARELGELRYAQDASIHQLLREYELLRAILEQFVMEHAAALRLAPSVPTVLACVKKINQAIAVLTQTTVDTFVHRYAETIAAQQQRLERFNRMVSHELRQPLAAVQAAAGLLKLIEKHDHQRRDNVVAAIDRNVKRLVEITQTVARVSRLTAAENQPSTQRVSLATVAKEAARQLRSAADDRGVAIEIDARLPELVVDVGQLELVLVNLISNGIKYSDPSKPERVIAVELRTLSDRECAIDVRDNGIGMDCEQVSNVFSPFYRGHEARDRELGVEGLGLGLTIVRDCAAALGARVSVNSEPSAGTTFTITLPRLA